MGEDAKRPSDQSTMEQAKELGIVPESGQSRVGVDLGPYTASAVRTLDVNLAKDVSEGRISGEDAGKVARAQAEYFSDPKGHHEHQIEPAPPRKED